VGVCLFVCVRACMCVCPICCMSLSYSVRYLSFTVLYIMSDTSSKMGEILRVKEKILTPLADKRRASDAQLDQSTVAAHEVYKSC